MELVNISVKSALEQLLALHKHATSDMEFMNSGFDIIQTLLNNIHMAQSHMFASLVGNVTKQYPVALKAINNMTIADDTNIDEYMTQFSNVSISAKNKIEPPTTVLSPRLNESHSEVRHENPQPIVKKGEGPIDRWLREQRQEEANHDIDNFEKEHYLPQPNIFNDDDPYNTEGPYNPGAWHDKINVDVEQCCARIGRQLFMIDHMEPEFLDNYPSDTYIDENGFVHGRACLRTIDTNLFNTGQIFCNDHAYGYEDIRKPPTCASPDIDFM